MDDALLEMRDTLAPLGFRVIAAAEVIAPHSVNTEIAYEVWGIDIDNFEKRLKKLRTLYGKDVRK